MLIPFTQPVKIEGFRYNSILVFSWKVDNKSCKNQKLLKYTYTPIKNTETKIEYLKQF